MRARPLAIGFLLVVAACQPDTVSTTAPGVGASTPASAQITTTSTAGTTTTTTPATAATLPGPATVIFFNGQVVTMAEGDNPTASALALDGETIIAVGATEDVMTLEGPNTQIIDLAGKTMIPGFVDPHDHLFNAAYRGERPELADTSYAEAEERLLSYGITTTANANVWPDAFEDFVSQHAGVGGLRMRTNVYLGYNDVCGERWPEDWYREHLNDDPTSMFRVVGIKVFVDSGTCGSPALSVPINDPFGTIHVEESELTDILHEAENGGFQVAMQTSGDRALDTAFSALEAALEGRPNDNRHRFEHTRIVRETQRSRFGELGAVPMIDAQPPVCAMLAGGGWSGLVPDDGPIVPLRPWFDNWRAMYDANPGLHAGWVSAAPRLTYVPMANLWAFVTRKEIREDGEFCEPPAWLAETALTPEEALRTMTLGGAYALQMEDHIGSLEVGKWADVVMLSDNPRTADPDAILEIVVLMTMVGGQVEYCIDSSVALCPTS